VSYLALEPCLMRSFLDAGRCGFFTILPLSNGPELAGE
jgi:hypothetical protein